jgi:predicted 3-demethylubiquinone-9 3-methyltransferase (glyoxalase superfamily)
MVAVQPFLMFQGEGSEALAFYESVLPTFRIDELKRYGPGEQGPEGQIAQARFTVGGQTAWSFWMDCGSEDEVRRIAEALGAGGGSFLMPVDNYGFSKLFAWVSDRFGVSWQISHG